MKDYETDPPEYKQSEEPPDGFPPPAPVPDIPFERFSLPADEAYTTLTGTFGIPFSPTRALMQTAEAFREVKVPWQGKVLSVIWEGNNAEAHLGVFTIRWASVR